MEAPIPLYNVQQTNANIVLEPTILSFVFTIDGNILINHKILLSNMHVHPDQNPENGINSSQDLVQYMSEGTFFYSMSGNISCAILCEFQCIKNQIRSSSSNFKDCKN